jgi:sodium transport system permease protein
MTDRPSLGSQAGTVYRKELRDAWRDHRTLWVVLASSVLLAPLMLWALSFWMADLQARADQRVLWVEGIERAPTLHNFLARQTYRVQAPPADVAERLRRGQFADPVLRVPPEFEAALARGEAPVLTLLTDSGNQRAQVGMPRLERLLAAFNQERATLGLALRGVSPELLQSVRVQEHDLASALSRGASIGAVLPWVFIMAVLSGALNAALDTTAGERERGSLEPLLMNPLSALALALGKWGAVLTVSSGVAVLSCLSFLPAQTLFRGDALRSLVQFGPWQALSFVVLLLPLAACVSALLMWVAIRCRSVKEAQASATIVVMLFTALPMLSSLNIIDAQRWGLLVPGLSQHALMGRVLKGEDLSLWQWLSPWGVAALVSGVCLVALARRWPRSVG